MEKIFLEKFVNQHGAIVEVPDSQGKRRKIKDSDPESWELAKNADLLGWKGNGTTERSSRSSLTSALNPPMQYKLPYHLLMKKPRRWKVLRDYVPVETP